MKKAEFPQRGWRTLSAGVAIAVGALTASAVQAVDVKVTLTGDEEVPAVKTSAKGTGMFAIANDNTIAGSVTTTGIQGTAAHIHEAAAGKNGPVIIPLTKSGDTYSVPAGTKLSESQLAAFKAGDLYVNVHSSANPGGEVRAQLKP